jgi:hypothetical protein
MNQRNQMNQKNRIRLVAARSIPACPRKGGEAFPAESQVYGIRLPGGVTVGAGQGVFEQSEGWSIWSVSIGLFGLFSHCLCL